MSKTMDELATEIMVAALAGGQVKTTASSGAQQGSDIASAYKKIREGVAGPFAIAKVKKERKK